VKRIVWTEVAKADVRALDKPTAMRVLSALHRFAESGAGDVKALQDREELRLRIGDYRLFFTYSAFEVIEVLRVVHRAKPTVDPAAR
jgi:mRNA interferase RelE/StbE